MELSGHTTAAAAYDQGPSSQTCVCGRSFLQLNALTKHKRTCGKTKKRLSSALDKAKEIWRGKKQRRLDHCQPIASSSGLIPLPLPETQDTDKVWQFLDDNSALTHYL
jgi:hypothetical protein